MFDNVNMNIAEYAGSLKEDALKIAERASEGEKTRNIAARIYYEGLKNKTEEQGFRMADSAIKAVKEFDDNMAAALDDKEKFIDKFLDETKKESPIYERCEYWLRFLAVSAALCVNDDAQKEQLLKDADSIRLTEEEATPEYELQLKKQIKEVLLSDELLTKHLTQTEEGMSLLSQLKVNPKINEDNRIDLRVILTMLIYVKSMNGELEGIPENITISQIAASVCMADKEIEAAKKLTAGDIVLMAAVGIISAAVIVFTVMCIDKVIAGSVLINAVADSALFYPVALLIGFILLEFLSEYVPAVVCGTAYILDNIADKIRNIIVGVKNYKTENDVNTFSAVIGMIKEKTGISQVNNEEQKIEENYLTVTS